MKKFLILGLAIILFVGAQAKTPEVNKRVLKTFSQTFANATDIRWSEDGNEFTAFFRLPDQICRVNFDKKGNIISSLKYFQPAMLPANIIASLNDEYRGKQLFSVTEVTVGQNMVYLVKLRDKDHWYTAKVDSEGNSEIIETFKRADK